MPIPQRGSPIYLRGFNASTGKSDGSLHEYFHQHSQAYRAFNDSGAAISEGEIVALESDAYNEHHFIKTRDSSTAVPVAVALEDIADGYHGYVADDGWVNILAEAASATVGEPFYASSALSGQHRATTEATRFYLGDSCGSTITDSITGVEWVRVRLALSSTAPGAGLGDHVEMDCGDFANDYGSIDCGTFTDDTEINCGDGYGL